MYYKFEYFSCIILLLFVNRAFGFNFIQKMIKRKPKIYKIADDTNPELRLPSLPVDVNQIQNKDIQELIEDMIATMKQANGIGLAAPQILVRKRIIVFYLPEQRDDINKVGVPLTVLINPEMTVLDATSIHDYEGCLSVPGKRGLVPRAQKIRYQGYNEQGEWIERVAEGWHARVFQHEYDHLNGILYPTLMAAEEKLLTIDEYLRLKS